MGKFSRIEVVTAMRDTGLVPVFYHWDLEECKKVLTTSYEAGIRVFEFTNRADFAHETFAELVKYSREKLDGMMLGIGSVIDPATTSFFLQSGADFIVSPLVNPEMAKICNRRKVAWIPGCGSITEINQAEELGAEVVKLFPATEVGGPSFIKAVKGPMPWTSIMPTGGVRPDKENLQEWFEAGAHCVGIGSKLFRKTSSGEFDYHQISEDIKKALGHIKSFRIDQ